MASIEIRSKVIGVVDKGNVLPSNEIFYGPYNSLEDAYDFISEYYMEMGVMLNKVPLGIVIAVYNDDTKTSITRYSNDKRLGTRFSINDFAPIGSKNSELQPQSGIYMELYSSTNYINIES